jgi:hypothetical protein
MNRIYQGKVTNVEIANPDQHASHILSASTAIPRPRERERVVEDRVSVAGEEPISAAAVLQLLAQKGDLNQLCVDRLPWLTPAAPGKRTERK